MDKIYTTDYWLVTFSSAGCLPDNEPTYFSTKAQAEKYAKQLWQEFIANGISEHNLYSVEVSFGEWV